MFVPKPLCNLKAMCLTSFWRSSRFQWFMRVVILRLILAWLFVLLIIRVMLAIEQRKVRKSPETLFLYEGDEVCGLKLPKNYDLQRDFLEQSLETETKVGRPYNQTDDYFGINSTDYASATEEQIQIQTFESAGQAREEDNIVGHCGSCGACSNPHDISIYDETKQSLFGTSTVCAKRGLIWGRKTATKCMEEKVGFTDDCTYCWVENMMCDLRYCVFTCFWQTMFDQIDSGDSQSLNRCTECDERRCGEAFVKCAGANRRRTGIVSDIDRDMENEVCKDVDNQWWNDGNIQSFYERTTLADQRKAQAPKSQQQDRNYNSKAAAENSDESAFAYSLEHLGTRNLLRQK